MDLVITFDRSAKPPLYQQLVAVLRDGVLSGRLKPNQKLPSSRLLAQTLGLSRATVTQSYDQLLSEGYLEARSGSGTYVCAQIPDDCLALGPMPTAPDPSDLPSSLSRLGNHLLDLGHLGLKPPEVAISFRYGSPATTAFPMALWRKLLYRHCHHQRALMDYGDAMGYLPLRTAIADYLGRSRAVRCTPDQVIIINGSQQALDLIARLTLDPGDWVAVEDPGYLGARHCFLGQGAHLQGIPVDAAGLDVDGLHRCSQSFKLLYLTPSHQFPTGAVLPLARRLALLQWAQQTGTLILEDDYDSEYRYGDRPIPALQGLDQHHRVIYVGTFSKILFPALRIGYLVVPSPWVSVIRQAKWLCDRQAPLLEQFALADLIHDGHFERHIRRMRQLYNRRRQALVRSLQAHLGDRVTILGESAGIHLMARLETPLSDQQVMTMAAQRGVGVISAEGYYLGTPKGGEFIFGYSQLEASEIEQGVKILAEILQQ